MDLVGQKIRNIEIRSVIGEGGVGVVYLGFDEVLQRKVALKVLRSARLNETNKARFLREARALSQLDHPQICRIFDTIEYGDQLVLVLEYVKGRSLAEILKLDLAERQRFDLAAQLTEALIAAHGQGIIHRDLKPENVIVTDDWRVKVLDFGLARLLTDDPEPQAPDENQPPMVSRPTLEETSTHQSTTVNTQATTDAVTELGSVMGTASYMSPEQALGEPLTTASDMYSLGIVFYELFTGETAYEPGLSLLHKMQKAAAANTRAFQHRDRALTELVARLVELKPPMRPRAVDVLDRLRWIRKRPLRRRRRIAVVIAVLLILAAGAKYTIDLRHEQAMTMAALEEAQQARAEADQVSDFLIDAFRISQPGEQRGSEVTAREILESSAQRLDDQLTDQPAVRARLQATIGKVFDLLGLHSRALRMLEDAVTTQRQLYPDGHPDLARSLHLLGNAYYMLDDYDKATAVVEESLKMCRGLEPADHLMIAANLDSLGQFLFDKGKIDEAEKLILESLEIRQSELPPDDPKVAASVWSLGKIFNERSEYARAEELYRQALESFEQAPGFETSVARVLEDIGALMLNQGRYREAEPLFRRSLEIRKQVLDPGHQNLAISASYLAHVTAEKGNFTEAEALLRDALSIFEDKLGPDHFNVAANLTMIGDLLTDTGKYQEARETYHRSLAILEAAGLTDNYNCLLARSGCGEVALRLGHLNEAERLLQATLDGWQRTIGLDSVEALGTSMRLCQIFDSRGQVERADPCWQQTYQRAMKLLNEDATDFGAEVAVAEMLTKWGRSQAAKGDPKSSRELFLHAREIVDRLVDDDADIGFLALQAEIYFLLGERDEARPLYERVHATGWTDPDLDNLAHVVAQR